MEKSRNLKRVVVYYPAKIYTQNLVIETLIKDLSSNGAQLQFKNAKLPHKFELEFSPVPGANKLRLLSHIQWQAENKCGVKFTNLSSLDSKVLSKLIKYHRLEE